MKTIAITGASGLIGRHLCDHFRSRGWTVRALLRRPGDYPFRQPGITAHALDLPSQIPAAALRGADVVVHAAYATRAARAADARAVNEAGTERLIAAARAAGVAKFVFVSSLSARADAPGYYGASKFAMEARLDGRRDLALRPGLVLASDGGLALRLWRAVAATHIAPVLDGGRQVVQTVHVDDLCAAFEAALASDASGTLSIAEPEGLSMSDLLSAFASASGVRAVHVPVPAALLLRLLRAAERFRIPAPVSSDNLLGLLSMRNVETAADLARLGVRVRPAPESIAQLAPLVRAGRRAAADNGAGQATQ